MAASVAIRRPGRVPYWVTTLGIRLLVRAYLRVRVEGGPLPAGPAILCFNHQSWADPFIVVAGLPARPDLWFFGPKEADMSVGVRNRLITWSGRGVPYNPERTNLLEATRQVEAVLASGARLGIAPEGRIHIGERALLPVNEGVAFFALRAGVPIVPVGLTGTGWLRFGKTIRVRVGTPIAPAGRPTRDAVDALTGEVRAALLALVSDGHDEAPPGPLGRWVTELFNDWPEGRRPSPPGAVAGESRYRTGVLYFERERGGGPVCDTRADERTPTGGRPDVGATGLAANQDEYRARLGEQADAQIDAWAAEAMRDISIRRGVLAVLHDYRTATGADDRVIAKVFAAGGGPPAVVGRDAEGRLLVPAIALHCLVAGTRAVLPDPREKLIEYLVENFGELVYT
jgi:1-acyl-sn-glycerol-3-phosphate acyltransferase